MFTRLWRVAAVALGLATIPVAAEASSAFVTGDVNLRTGPSTSYYRITVMPAGSQVEVYGCLQGYSWCDVSYYQERGWVSSRYLSIFYTPQQVYVPYRPQVSVPFLSFSFGYWDNHYVGRPWYVHRPPVYNPPVYRPPVYRPPVYRPPIYQPWRPGDDDNWGGNGWNNNPGYRPPNAGKPPLIAKPNRPFDEQPARPGKPPLLNKPGKPFDGPSGKPGKNCVWINGQCLQPNAR